MFLLLRFRLMQNRARPRALTRMRSKSGSPPTPKAMSPAATPITPVFSGMYSVDDAISLPPIPNTFSTSNKTTSNGTFLRLPR